MPADASTAEYEFERIKNRDFRLVLLRAFGQRLARAIKSLDGEQFTPQERPLALSQLARAIKVHSELERAEFPAIESSGAAPPATLPAEPSPSDPFHGLRIKRPA